MKQWSQDMLRLLKWVLYFVSAIIILFVVNQLLSLYQFFSQFHWLVGVIIVVVVLAGLFYFGYQLFKVWRKQPVVLEMPANDSPEAYQKYLELLRLRLRKNEYLADFDFDDTELPLSLMIEKAFGSLEERSLPIIKENANAIFLSTAISQNGALDSLVVLTTLMRMVWQLSNVYQTRPTLKGMVKLYMQVASIVLMARAIEDVDLIEGQLEPLITSVIGESIASAIPGMVPISNLVVSSLLEGSINAFLTLRVGLIAQHYLGMSQMMPKQALRRHTSVQALTYMGNILKDNSKVVVKSVAKAVKNAGKGATKKWFENIKM